MKTVKQVCNCFEAVMEEAAKNLTKGNGINQLISILQRLGYSVDSSRILKGLVSISGRNHLCRRHSISLSLRTGHKMVVYAGVCHGEATMAVDEPKTLNPTVGFLRRMVAKYF